MFFYGDTYSCHNIVETCLLNFIKNGKVLLLAAFLLKILLAGFFSSDFVSKIFVPFVQLFFTDGYGAWGSSSTSFPYPPLMVFILLIPVKLVSMTDSIFLQNLFFSIPLFVSDYLIYKVLKKLLPSLEKEIILFFAFSPILLYSTYIHSQLDIIPTSILMYAVFYLLKNRLTLSFLLLGFAVAIKWHTVISFPLFVIYLIKNRKIKKSIFFYLLYFIVPIVLSLVPFGDLENLLNMFKFKERNMLFESYLAVLDLKIYLFPILYVLILGRFFAYKRVSNELLMGMLAILFLGFVVIIYPNPGWFLWSLPFLVYSFVKNSSKRVINSYLYGLVCVSYILFFLFSYQHPYHDFSNIIFLDSRINLRVFSNKVNNISFTTMVAFLFLTIYAVYKSAIKSSLIYERKFQSFLIGIAGDSGAGKTTLLNLTKKVLGADSMTSLEGDAEHKWERGSEQWKSITHLNPRANHLHNQLMHLIKLKKGNATKRTNYNHSTGKFDRKKKVISKAFIAISGLHPFYLKGARENIDLKIYVDTDEVLRKHWKVLRDTTARGYSVEAILEQISTRESDSRNYVYPQRKYADLVIKYFSSKKVEVGISEIDFDDILVRYDLDIDFPVDNFLKMLQNNDVQIKHHDFDDDLVRQSVVLKIPQGFESINCSRYFDEFFQLMNINDSEWETGINGVNQLIILHCIKCKYLGLDYE